MEPDICPPWWPNLLWSLLHHHGPGPGPDKNLVNRLDAHFAAIAVSALSTRLADSSAREEVGRIAGELASDPMPAFAQAVRVD